MKKSLTVILILVCLATSVQGQKFNIRQSMPATIIIAASNSANKNTPYICSGSSDEDKINIAIIAAGSGGTVYLSEGLYTIDGSILPTSNITIIGSGYGTKIQIATGTLGALNMIDCNGITKVRIANLLLDGNNGMNTCTGNQKGIYLHNTSHSIVENCWIEHLGHINKSSCEAIVPTGSGTTYCVIKNNIITDTVDGINTADSASYLTIIGNIITSTNRDYGLNISGCYDSIWSNNIVTECYKEGIRLVSSSRCIVSNNFVRNCGRQTDNTYAGIKSYSGTNNFIFGNVVRNATSDNTQAYGIWNYAGTDIRIFNNDLASSGSTSDFYEQTAAISRGNITTSDTGATGTGDIVLATSPTLITPTLGVALATSINGITTPALIKILATVPDVNMMAGKGPTTLYTPNGKSAIVTMVTVRAPTASLASSGTSSYAFTGWKSGAPLSSLTTNTMFAIVFPVSATAYTILTSGTAFQITNTNGSILPATATINVVGYEY
jgi:parallel beta-helix repeat protein